MSGAFHAVFRSGRLERLGLLDRIVRDQFLIVVLRLRYDMLALHYTA